MHQGHGPVYDIEDGKWGAGPVLLGQTPPPPPSAALCQLSSVLPAPADQHSNASGN